MKNDRFDRAVWETVASIPRGKVMSYGEVATAAGYPRRARMVSKAMSRCEKQLPWYRVVRSDRKLAFSPSSDAYHRQKRLLEAEGVVFTNGKAIAVASDQSVDLDELLWGLVDS